MELSRIRLKLEGGFITPWQSDTIFGHLCWALVEKEGEDACSEFVESFVGGNPPFLVSNGFPSDLIPVPLNLFFNVAGRPDAREKKFRDLKQLKKLAWIDFSMLPRVAEMNLEPRDLRDIDSSPFTYSRRYRNTINRITQTTGSAGALFEIEEVYLNTKRHDYLSIYLYSEPDWIDRVYELFQFVSCKGFGKKKNIGMGSFSLAGLDDLNDYVGIENADAFLTLSNYVPSSDDPTEGFYKILIKYGKLGEDFATSGMQFKKPLVMFEAGSVFRTNGLSRKHYGRMVKGLVPGMPEVVQYGYAFPVPIRI